MPFCERTRLFHHHERHKAAAINLFRAHRRVQSTDKKRLGAYVNQLNADIDRLFDAFHKENNAKVFDRDFVTQ